MATQPNSQYEPETELIELTVMGQKIYDDLRLYYLPGETVDFVVDGKDGYVVQFEDPNAFGTSLAVLTKGNNLFVRMDSKAVRARVYSQVELVKTLPTLGVSTTVIVIPPPRPKFPPNSPQIVGPGPQ